MNSKNNINNLADLAKFRNTVIHLTGVLEDLKVEVIALLHTKESLERENATLRRLLKESE